MRALHFVPAILAITLGAGIGASPALAGPRIINVEAAADKPQPVTEANFKKYRGYMYDLSEYAGRKDADALEENLKRQLDMVEEAGFGPRILEFFHTVPIVATDTDCLELGATLACYGRLAPNRSRRGTLGVTVWDGRKHQWSNPDIVELAADSGTGVIMLRTTMA